MDNTQGLDNPEKKPETSEDGYRAIFDAANDAIFIHDPSTGAILDVNKKMTEMYGYTLDEARTLSVGDISSGIPPYTREGAAERIRQALSGESSPLFEWQARDKDGRVFWVEVNLKQSFIHGMLRIVAIARDITERMKAQQELRESEKRFRTLYEASFGGISIHEKGIILDCNQGLADMTGYTRSELIGMDGLMLIAPAWRDYAMQKILSGFEARYDAEGLRKDGSVYPLEIQGKNIPYHGRTVRVTEFRDLSEHRRAERALRQSEERFRKLADAMPQLVWTAEPDGLVDYYNIRHRDYQGINQLDNGAFHWGPVLHDDDLEPTVKAWHHALKTGGIYQIEHRVKMADGAFRWHLSRGVPVRGENGAIVKWYGTATDIDDVKRSEEKIRHLNADLRRRVEELQTLLDVIPIGIGIAESRDSRTIRGNRAFEEILGMKQGANLSLSAGPDERPKNFTVSSSGTQLTPEELPLQMAASQGTVVQNFEVDVVRDDGVLVSMLEFAAPLYDASGNIRGSVGAFLDITDRKRAEDALRASEERYRVLYDSMEQGVAEFDEGGKLVSANQAADNILGIDLGKMLGRPFLEVFRSIPGAAEDNGEPFDAHCLPIMETLETGKAALNKVVRFSAAGKAGHRWASVDLIPRVHKGDSGGRDFVRIFVIFSDITEVKNAQESLRKTNEELEQKVKFRTRALAQTVDQLKEQKEILQTIIDNIPVMLTFYDETGKVRLVNREFEKLAGWSLEEARAKDLMAALYPDPQYRAKIWDSMMREKVSWKDTEITTRSGDLLQSSWANIRLSDGSRVGIGIDMTARKKMEQDLLRLAAAIRQAEEGIVLFSPDGIVEYVNPAYEILTGYEPNELIGKTTEFFDAEMHELYRSIFEQIKAGGESWTGRLTRTHREGSDIEIILSVSPVRNETGRIINFVAVIQDVTREVLLQQQVSQSQKMEALGTLAGGIAHDLKNVLTPILINTEIALEDVGSEDPARPMLEEVLGAAQIGSDLVKQIVTFSRRSPQEKKPVVVSSIIRETLSFLRSSLPSTIEIRSRIYDECSTVLADPTQIKQVMINLGSNAGHAMKEQGGILEVELSDSVLSEETASLVSPDLAEGSYMKITVSDTGTGMDEKTAKRIFEPFFTTKKKSEGSGMGLAVVHGIVKDHKGAITVRSTPGKGSVFAVFLPRIEKTETDDGCENGTAS